MPILEDRLCMDAGTTAVAADTRPAPMVVAVGRMVMVVAVLMAVTGCAALVVTTTVDDGSKPKKTRCLGFPGDLMHRGFF